MTQVGFQYIALKLEAHALAFAGDFDKAGIFQFLDVVGKCGCGDRMPLAHIAAQDASAFRANLLQDFVAARIGESLGDEAELALGEPGLRGRSFALTSGRHLYFSY